MKDNARIVDRAVIRMDIYPMKGNPLEAVDEWTDAQPMKDATPCPCCMSPMTAGYDATGDIFVICINNRHAWTVELNISTEAGIARAWNKKQLLMREAKARRRSEIPTVRHIESLGIWQIRKSVEPDRRKVYIWAETSARCIELNKSFETARMQGDDAAIAEYERIDIEVRNSSRCDIVGILQ